jgi:hypothetical protein
MIEIFNELFGQSFAKFFIGDVDFVFHDFLEFFVAVFTVEVLPGQLTIDKID